MVFHLHPENPEKRKVNQIIEILRDGGVIVLPTDSVYAFACLPESKEGVERIRQIKGMHKNDYFTVMCPDISAVQELTTQIDNEAFKILKKNTSGPFTFIFDASKKLPKIIFSKRNSIGVRIPNNDLIQTLLTELEDYLVSTSVVRHGDEINRFYYDEDDLQSSYGNLVDAVVISEAPPFEPSAIIDFTTTPFEIVRPGPQDLVF